MLVSILVSIWLQKGCDVNRKDREENMPLSLCVRYHHDRYCSYDFLIVTFENFIVVSSEIYPGGSLHD